MDLPYILLKIKSLAHGRRPRHHRPGVAPWGEPPGPGAPAAGVTYQLHADVVLLELGLSRRRQLPARADIGAVALRGELGVECLAEAARGHDAGLGREVAHHSQGLRATQRPVRLSLSMIQSS